MNNPAAVILIPAFRCGHTIGDTLRSILAQGPGLQRIRCVIVADDGSGDDTLDVVRRTWTSDVPMALAASPVNRGEYTNVNEAIAALPDSIEWFFIMHADNEAKPGWIDGLLDAAAAAPAHVASICSSWEYRVGNRTVELGSEKPEAPIETIAGDRASVRGTLFKGCWWHNSASIIRVEAFRKVGGMPLGTPLETVTDIVGITRPPAFAPPSVPRNRLLRVKGDWDLLLRFLESGWSIQHLQRSLLLYKDNDEGVSSITFRRHHDLIETLQVVRRHLAALGIGDSLALHVRMLAQIARRAAGAVARVAWDRAFAAFRAILHATASLLACLVRQLTGRAAGLASIPFRPDPPSDAVRIPIHEALRSKPAP